MSDKLENFIRSNRGKFDQQSPRAEVWNNIQTGLAQNAAAGASSAGVTSAATKSGIAKIAGIWKLTAAVVATVATASVVYFTAFHNPEGNDPQKNNPPITSNEGGGGGKVEFLETASPLVNPPMPEADVAFASFSMDADKGGTWEASTGTVITVPKSAFVDENGKPVKGEVQLRYREFHDGADIVMSGIPMTYDDKGNLENFQTAGMMELRGFQDGKPVYIAEGSSVDISMASFTDEDDYNLYYLDLEKGGWADIGKADLKRNKKKEDGLRLLKDAPKPPLKPAKGIPGVEQENEISFAVNYKDFPELKPFKKVRWQATDPAYMKRNEGAFAQVWTNVELKEIDSETMEYKIVLKNKRKRFEVNVTPVLEGKDYDKAMEKFRARKEKYDRIASQRKNESTRLEAQADMLRSFSVTGFGIYNCDRFWRIPDPIAINKAHIEISEDTYLDAERTLVYQIAGENRAVVSHRGLEINDFRFTNKEDNYLVVILANNKVAVYGPEQFRKIDVQKAASTGEHTFVLEPSEKEVKSAADLRRVLGV